MNHLSIWLGLALSVTAVHAQSNRLLQTHPAHGSTGVGTSTTVTFQFHHMIPEEVTLDDIRDAIVPYPEDRIEIHEAAILPGRMSVAYSVTHQAGTDYWWTFSADWLLRNQVVSYSTAASRPSTTLEATLSGGGGYEKGFAILSANADFPFTNERPDGIGGLAVIDSYGVIRFEGVRPGAYYVTIVTGHFDIGIHDADLDGLPDPVAIGSTPVQGLEIAARPMEQYLYPISSEQRWATAIEAATAMRSDATLKMLAGYDLVSIPVDPTSPFRNPKPNGRSLAWSYVFHSPSTGEVIDVEMMSNGYAASIRDEAERPDGIDRMPALPDGAVSSDAAIASAARNGMDAFLEAVGTEVNIMVSYSLGFGAEGLGLPFEVPDRFVWHIGLMSIAEGPGVPVVEIYQAVIDAQTGQPYGHVSTSVDRGPDPIFPDDEPVALYANYPNPFNPSTAIPFQVNTAGRVRLSVYDVLGREVAVLVDGMLAPGSHTARFDAAGLASGVYLVRLEMGGTSLTRRMTLAR